MNDIIKSNKKEKWKPLKYYDESTDYFISSQGNIYSCKTNKIIKLRKCGKYFTVMIYINKRAIQEYIHRLVAMNFIPIPKKLLKEGYDMHTLEVNHKKPASGKKKDNRKSNLEWVTHSKNISHNYDINLLKTGEDSHLHKTNTAYQVKEVCLMLEENKFSIPYIAKRVGIPERDVYDIYYKNNWVRISSKFKIDNYTPKNERYSKQIKKEILRLFESGVSRKEISTKFNIPYKNICYIISSSK